MLPIIENAKTEILNALGTPINALKSTFETWKTDWTTERAEKIDTTADAIAELDADVGESTDAAGTATSGTVHGKLRKILTDYTTTRAGYIDQIPNITTRVNDIDADLGETSDSGGNVNTGTAMAKLNRLLERGAIKRSITGYIAWNHTGWSEKTISSGSSAKQIRTQVTIPTVYMSKSMVLVDVVAHSGREVPLETVVAFLSDATTLEIRLPGGLGTSIQSDFREVNYQIIEFY